jgi:hypothetical protein
MKYSWKCKFCGCVFEYENENEFDVYGEEELWNHIQMKHMKAFEECQNLDTPTMLDECYIKGGVNI